MGLDKFDKLFLGGILGFLTMVLLCVAIVIPEHFGILLAMASMSFLVAFIMGYMLAESGE